MRKIILKMTIAVCVVTLMSCEKKYTCTCNVVDVKTGEIQSNWGTRTGTFTKTDAEKWCYDNETKGAFTRIECDLK